MVDLSIVFCKRLPGRVATAKKENATARLAMRVLEDERSHALRSASALVI